MMPRLCGPLVSARLELLLIFSALLSAVTGALTGARAPETRHYAVAPVESAAASAPRAVTPARTAAVRAIVVAIRPRDAVQGLAFALKLPAPLETIRLIE
jgi:hypothetical protein